MGMFGRGFLESPTARNVLGSIGDGLLLASGNKPMYWPMQMQGRQQALEFQRQAALKQFEAMNPQPTPMQKNYEYLQRMNPALAETYLRAEANPMTLMTDPMTGNLRFMPKGGDPSIAPMPGGAQPMSKVINGKTYYSPNGADWYDNPEMQ
jgi:hypothetical protein